MSQSTPKWHLRLREQPSLVSLGFDVGKENPALGVSKISKTKQPKMLHGELPKRKITNLGSIPTINRTKEGAIKSIDRPIREQVREFSKQVHEWVDEYNPDVATIERFQIRGSGRFIGQSGEFCNIIVGVMATVMTDRKVPFILIPASQWKTQFNNQAKNMNFSVPKGNAKTTLDHFYKEVKVPPHIVDAMLMSIYTGMQIYDQVPFENFRINWVRDLL